MRPVYVVHKNSTHFNLIMDKKEDADKYKSASFGVVSDNNLPFGGANQEEKLVEEVRKIINNRYDPTQQKLLDVQMKKMFDLAKDLQEQDLDKTTKIVELATGFQNSLNEFLKLSIPERKGAFEKFKKEFLDGLRKSKPQISWGEKLKGCIPFFFSATPEQNLKTTLDRIESIVNSPGFTKTSLVSEKEKKVKEDFNF